MDVEVFIEDVDNEQDSFLLEVEKKDTSPQIKQDTFILEVEKPEISPKIKPNKKKNSKKKKSINISLSSENTAEEKYESEESVSKPTRSRPIRQSSKNVSKITKALSARESNEKVYKLPKKASKPQSFYQYDATGKYLKCDPCKLLFHNKHNYENHMELAHTKKKKYMCRQCQNTYDNIVDMKLHLQVHMKEKITKQYYKCSECSRNFSKLNDLKFHKKKMHSEENEEGDDDDVDEAANHFDDEQNYDGHNTTNNDSNDIKSNNFPVSVKRNFIDSDNNIEIHETMEETLDDYDDEMDNSLEPTTPKVRKLMTSTPISTKRKSKTNKSPKIQGYNSNQIPANASFKLKEFVDRSGNKVLKRVAIIPKQKMKSSPEQIREYSDDAETVTHGGLTMHRCRQCDAHFISKLKLTEHLATVHDWKDSYSCDVCNDEFSCKEALIEHKKVHNNTHNYLLFVGNSEAGEKTETIMVKKENAPDENFEDSLNNLRLTGTPYPAILEDENLHKIMSTNKIFRTLSEEKKPCYIILPKKIAAKKGLLTNNANMQELTVESFQDLNSNITNEVATMLRKLDPTTEEYMDPNKSLFFNTPQQVTSYNEDNIAASQLQGEQYENLSTVDSSILVSTSSQNILPTSTSTTNNLTYSYICNYCRDFFMTSNELQEHMKIHLTEQSIACDYCGRWFKQQNLLNDHMARHTQEKSYPCNTCGKGFNRAEQLAVHMNKMHRPGYGSEGVEVQVDPSSAPFYCKICDKTFQESTFKKAHMTEHYSACGLCCHQCGETFKSEDLLQRHLPVHLHEQTKPRKKSVSTPKAKPIIKCVEIQKPIDKSKAKYKCSQCFRAFVSKKNKLLHERMHEVTVYKCEKCPVEFKTEQGLAKHQQDHITQPYSCGVCKQKFVTVGDTKQHIISEHDGEGVVIASVPVKKK